MINTPKDFESIPGYCATFDTAEEELWSEQKGSCRIVYWKENTASFSGKFLIRTNDQYNNGLFMVVIPKVKDSNEVIGYLEGIKNIAEFMQKNNITSLRTSTSAQDLTNDAKLERRIAWRLSKILKEAGDEKINENRVINNNISHCKELLSNLKNLTTKEGNSIGWAKEGNSIGWTEALIDSDLKIINNIIRNEWKTESKSEQLIRDKIINRLTSLKTDIVEYIKLVKEENLKQESISEEKTGIVELEQKKLRFT